MGFECCFCTIILETCAPGGINFRCFREALTSQPFVVRATLSQNEVGPKNWFWSSDCFQRTTNFKGPAERATSKNVKNRQKVSTYFRHFSTFFAQGKKPQKSSKNVNNSFGNFRVAPVFRPFLGGSDA